MSENKLSLRGGRRRGPLVAFGVILVAAVAVNGGADTPATEPEAVGTTTTSAAATTTSSTGTTSTSPATTTVPTTTTSRPVPFPDQDRAEILFAVPIAGPSGDPQGDPPPGAEVATVSSITDGDTLRVSWAGGTEPLRIIGINSPERGECFAAEAAAVLEWLAPVGSTVWLTRDQSDRDQYDRLLRHVWIGNLSVGEEMVRRGAALAREYPPDLAMADRLGSAQLEAKESGLGLWAKDACGQSAGYDLVITQLQADAPGNDHENLNGEFVVIRNQSEMGVDMTGWMVKDESATHRFSFPAGYVLGAGASVTIYTGCGQDSAAKLYWCSPRGAVWNNDGDTAFLLDHHGNVVHDLGWMAPATTTTQPKATTTQPKTSGGGGSDCDPSYPTVCIPPYPPDLNCGDIPHRRFKVLPPDPHGFDGDNDGIGCES